jgi:hypothetical protein
VSFQSQQIRKALVAGGPSTVEDLSVATGYGTDRVLQFITQLRADGVRVNAIGVKGQPVRFALDAELATEENTDHGTG